MTMRIRPPMTRSAGRKSASGPARNVAVMPRIVNTTPNPATYASAWRTAVQRDGGAPDSDAATAMAVIWPR